MMTDVEILSSNQRRVLSTFSGTRHFIVSLSLVGFIYFNEALWFNNYPMYLLEALIIILCVILGLMSQSFEKHVAGSLYTLSLNKILEHIDQEKE